MEYNQNSFLTGDCDIFYHFDIEKLVYQIFIPFFLYETFSIF